MADQLQSGVVRIYSTTLAYAALKNDGSVVTWGHNGQWGNFGQDSSSVANQLASDVVHIFTTDSAFAALKSDGSIVAWGNAERGGNSSAVDSLLASNVVSAADPFYNDVLVNDPTLGSRSAPLSLTIDTTAPLLTYGTEEASLVENSGAGQVILAPTSIDYASAVSYRLKAGNFDDASAFSIDGSTGEVTLTQDPDFEAKESYFFTVVATDSAGNSTEQPLSLRVNDVDDTAPFLITQDTNLPIASNRHINVGDDGVISVQFNVEDTQSTTAQIKAVFESPSGAQTRVIVIDPANLSLDDQKVAENIFRTNFSLDQSNVVGGSAGYVEGGEWSIKELTLEDSLGNKQTINKENLPSNLTFTVNNSPSTQPAFVGKS